MTANDAIPGDPALDEPGPRLPARRLERLLGKPPATWTADDLTDLAEDRGVGLVHLMHVGGDGWLKTLDFVPRSVEHLRDVLEGGERADGSSLFPGSGIRAGRSDVLLRPRIETAFLDPFAPAPALAVLCGHADRDGTPLEVSPDTIVRRAAERVRREVGMDLHALAEVEYFLGKRGGEEDVYGADDRGYHATAPFVFGETLRREALLLLSGIGVPIKYGHSEVGYIPASDGDPRIWEQHEIEMALAPLPEAADAVVLVQWVLRNLAHRRGFRASFEPILRPGHPGSGLHVHLSPVRAGRHLGGKDGEGRLEAPGRQLVAGLVRHGASLMAFGNRVEDSFVRLLQGKEAPTSVAWGDADRQALIRIPIVARAADGRVVSPPTVEFRLPDGSAHPHLLLAGLAQAFLAGATEPDLDGLLEWTAAARVRQDPSAAARLPKSAREVGEALLAHRAVLEAGGVFPTATLDALAAALRR